MRNLIIKATTALAALAAIVGISAGQAKASSQPQQNSDEAPLVLEHGVQYHWTEGGTHWSHGSHQSHSSHYSSR
ncbi:hypothetical protein KI811_07910 [Geobacter hydrogenophilus]|uniref:Uncharacterized protein n=1 Tax=Geobacter hydrogenophilus TaxID=40983 RepID=A0A9W6FZB0_9BACT|nr:hypothetical protein [Geobacter hydrogenophilus]MBT0893735.1 hypothetical protein [Geobacter hydrogenophilus]GLI37569.1 hypothetical protein GHYDROH2_10700 [Geobacter hydrogenophilus]